MWTKVLSLLELKDSKTMSKLNWNRLLFFAGGTFLGSYVISLFSSLFSRGTKRG